MPEKTVPITCYLFLIKTLAHASDFRVVGTTEVSISDYPYQVSLEVKGENFCCGVIVAPNKVLTAAHCIGSNDLLVRCGSNIRSKSGQVIYVKHKQTHPLFNFNTRDYDLGVLTLQEDFIINDKCRAVPLSNNTANGNRTCWVSGWGYSDVMAMSPKLQAVDVQEVPHENCREIYKYQVYITDRMVCFGDLTKAKGPCYGDSGGPLVDKVTYELVGITSWGGKCGSPLAPGVYTNVAVLYDWIMNEIKREASSSASRINFFFKFLSKVCF